VRGLSCPLGQACFIDEPVLFSDGSGTPFETNAGAGAGPFPRPVKCPGGSRHSILIRGAAILLLFALLPGGAVFAQPSLVRESDTPIALHYARIMNDYIAFIEPRLDAKEDPVTLSRAYFERLGYRLIAVSIRTTREPRVSRSWKTPGSKLAVLPRTTCYVSAAGATVELYDQGDDYVRIQNFTEGASANPGVYVSIGITHRWK